MIQIFRPCYCVLLLVFTGCGSKAIKTSDEVEGEYAYRYPSGQIEVIYINRDLTYRQQFYADRDECIRDSPSHTNVGVWSFSGNELEMKHFLAFCEFRDPRKVASVPRVVTMANVGWYSSSRNHDAVIDIFADNGYVLHRIKSRSDIPLSPHGALRPVGPSSQGKP